MYREPIAKYFSNPVPVSSDFIDFSMLSSTLIRKPEKKREIKAEWKIEEGIDLEKSKLHKILDW